MKTMTLGLLLGMLLGPLAAGPSRATPRPAIELRRAALLSVYFHAQGLDPSTRRPELRPLSLDDAVDVLVQDAAASPVAGEITRRLAVVRLALGGLRVSPAFTPLLRFRKAVANLSPVPIASIEALIQHAIDQEVAANPQLQPDEVLARIRRGLPQALYELINEPGYPGGCVHTIPTKGTGDQENYQSPLAGCAPPQQGFQGFAPAFASAEFRVKRTLAQVATAIDPQTWDQCSDFFADTRAVEEDQPGHFVGQTCPPKPASEWSGSLFEHFVQTWGGTDSQFLTILRIQSDRTPDEGGEPTRYIMSYCLQKSLADKIGNDASGSIDVDEGFARVDPATAMPGFQDVLAVKRVRFTGWPDDEQVNEAAQVYLTLLGDAAAVGSCCIPPEPAACVAPVGPPPGP